ncbi:dienelactone hydrolase family protein [uncultured Thiodictyon sp.]|uniref:dienelactone hydrolase family protein n=1 Tax=uncultured Thiodictyon sp. TaxID=1846217 RepID=UPI0025E0C7A3|nr:dienelactone hydrolase family protein [uncultured Thiodictyon sp.]
MQPTTPTPIPGAARVRSAARPRRQRLTARAPLTLTLALLLAGRVDAAIQTEAVQYHDGDQVLTGYLTYDDALTGERPGVLVAHEWWGLNDYAKRRAHMLAELGYVAFAADLYGDHKVTTHAADAQGWMTQITANQAAWQQRAQAGLDALKASDKVDGKRLAAIGYCFGGATVMQLAYAGADLAGVVNFHGALPPAGEGQPHIKPSILIAHGEKDSMVPPARVSAFLQGLDAAGADWQMVTYAGAEHAFTNPEAGSYGVPGVKYDAKADARSWALMKDFLHEVFSR